MATPLALRATAQWWRRDRRALPTTIALGILAPVGYLASLGLGIGRYVGRDPAWLGGVRYVAWLAPGLLAATSLQSSSSDCLWTVYGAVNWSGQYKSQTASPLRPRDAMLGHWAYVVQRMLVGAALQVAVMGAFGAWRRPTAPLALVAATLCGASVAPWLMAWAVTRRTDNFSIVQRFAIAPMFLFSGTFFPVDQLPAALRGAVYATPLYHGIELCRGLMLPGASPGALALHAAYLGALMTVGLAVATRLYGRVLTT